MFFLALNDEARIFFALSGVWNDDSPSKLGRC